VRAKLRVFPSCGNLIRQIPNQIHDDVHVEDLLKNDDDHACDTVRYLLMGQPRIPKKPRFKRARTADEEIWDEYMTLANSRRGDNHPVLGAV